MAEKCSYNHTLEIDSITRNKSKLDLYDDVNISTKNSTLIFNLCNDIAKKIKEQVIDVIGHVPSETSSNKA